MRGLVAPRGDLGKAPSRSNKTWRHITVMRNESIRFSY
jgi:hypothetical protein